MVWVGEGDVFLREASRKVYAQFHLLPWGAEGTRSLGEKLCLLLMPTGLAKGTCSGDGLHIAPCMMPWKRVFCGAGEA